MPIEHQHQRSTFGLCSDCGQSMPRDSGTAEPAQPQDAAAPPAVVVAGQMETARVMFEVVAGLLPGRNPDPLYTRRWVITSRRWQEAQDQGKAEELLAEYNGRMQGYAALLMLQPNAFNWVRTDWVWT